MGEEIQQDLKCIVCRYNLRGLMDDGLCPECGTRIVHSLQSRMLLHANPEWVKQVAEGATLISILVVIWPVGVVVSSFAGHRLGNKFSFYLGALLPSLFTLRAYLQFTSRETGCLRPERLASARRLARTLAIIAFLVTVVSLVMIGMGQALTSQVAFAIIGINLVKAAAMLCYAKEIAVRIPDESLAGRVVIALWGVVFSSVAVVLTFFIPRFVPAMGFLFGLSTWVLMAFLLFSLILARELSTTLRRSFLDQFDS